MLNNDYANSLINLVNNAVNKVNENPTDTNKEKAIVEIGLALIAVIRHLEIDE